MPKYMLLLHEPATLAERMGRELSPEQIQAMILRYKDWAGGLAAAGKLAGGDKLQDMTGRVLKSNAGSVHVTDGPYVESKEVIGGYFVLDAASYDEAVELSRGCPHLEFGAVEIREVEPT
ncbi:MAG: transcription initiation protein [Acidobacteria bacterium]|nr:transcription initiation protein [Acidobacteriota bacterium]